MKIFYQCKLRIKRQLTDTYAETTGWIESRGARVGARVELQRRTGELWEVTEVYHPGLPESVLRDTQLLNRGSLPSVESMG